MELERDWNNVQGNRYKICTKDLCLFPSCDTSVFKMFIPILLFRVFTMYIPILLFYASSKCIFPSCYSMCLHNVYSYLVTLSLQTVSSYFVTLSSKCLFLTWHTMSEDLLIWLSWLFVSSLHWLPHFLCWRRM